MKKLLIVFVIIYSCKSSNKQNLQYSDSRVVDSIGSSNLQRIEEFETKLVKIFEKSDEFGSLFHSHWSNENFDSVDYDLNQRDSLRNEFIHLLINKSTSYPNILEYDFPKFKDIDVYLYTANDKKFRIYGWFDDGGGTMHTHTNIFQYKSDSVYAQWSGIEDDLVRYDSVYTLKAGDRTIYIASYSYVAMGSVWGAGFQFFEIQDDTLNTSVYLLKDKEGLSTRINIDYRPTHENDSLPNTICTDNGKTIKIRALEKDDEFPDNDVLTDQYTTYHFNGNYFEEVRTYKEMEEKQGK